MKSFSLFYKEVNGNEKEKCKYTTRLDTYGCGCQHDCNYCYAKSLLDFRNLWNSEKPVVGNMKQIYNAIKKIPKGSIVRLGGMTDCFQPIELKYRTTYQTIKLLNKKRIGYLIVTKSNLVANEEYMKIYDKDLAHFQITTTCLDDELYKKLNYEKAPLPSKRIEAILKLQNSGFDVAIRLSPLIEEYIDFDMSEFGFSDNSFDAINDLLNEEFIDRVSNPKEFAVTFNFPIDYKLQIEKFIRENGKEYIVDKIIEMSGVE